MMFVFTFCWGNIETHGSEKRTCTFSQQLTHDQQPFLSDIRPMDKSKYQHIGMLALLFRVTISRNQAHLDIAVSNL